MFVRKGGSYPSGLRSVNDGYVLMMLSAKGLYNFWLVGDVVPMLPRIRTLRERTPGRRKQYHLVMLPSSDCSVVNARAIWPAQSCLSLRS